MHRERITWAWDATQDASPRIRRLPTARRGGRVPVGPASLDPAAVSGLRRRQAATDNAHALGASQLCAFQLACKDVNFCTRL